MLHGYVFLSGNLFSLFLCIVSKDGDEEESGKMTSGRLSLKAFNIHHVLEKGSYLMAADEKFFEAEDENMRKFCTDYEHRQCWLLLHTLYRCSFYDALAFV